MPANNGPSDGDDMDAFRKFIEQSLDLAGLPGERRQTPPEGAPDLTRYNPTLADLRALQRDIRQAWNALHREQPGQSYWAFRLTLLELETRDILQKTILTRLQKRFTGAPTEDDLRSMIAYAMLLSWLILGALEEKHRPPHDELNADDLLDFCF